ncbi:MAG: hypothetical protein ACRDGA_02255 [Bacteroidota bacterium]
MRLIISGTTRKIAFIFTLSCSTLSAQSGLKLQSSEWNIGARATALAEAYAAEAHDVSAMYWNPAALPFLQRLFVLVDYAQNVDHTVAGYAMAVPLRLDNYQVIAIGARINRSMGELQNEYPGREYSIDVATARTVASGLSIGIRASYHHAEHSHEQRSIGSGSMGISYTPDPKISYALTYHGLELASSRHAETDDPAVGWERIPSRFGIGMTMRYPSSQRDRVLTFSLANEKTVGQRGLTYKGGLELVPWSFLALRTGYLAGPTTSGMRYGVGLMTEYLQAAYAFVPHGIFGKVHQFSFLLKIWD